MNDAHYLRRMGAYPSNEIGADELFGGDEEIFGDDFGDDIAFGDEEIAFGAAPAARKAAIRRLKMRNAVGVGAKKYDRSRIYLLGQQALAVAAGAAANIQAQPQWPYRIIRYVIPATFAVNFVINQLTVGQQNVFAAAGAAPAEGFSEAVWGSMVLFDSASVGSQITTNVTSIAAANADFRAVAYGNCARD